MCFKNINFIKIYMVNLCRQSLAKAGPYQLLKPLCIFQIGIYDYE